MKISTDNIKELRAKCGAGVMECRSALIKSEGDMEKAMEDLKEQGCLKAAKKVDRVTEQGLVEAYIHIGGRVGAIVEVNCETDFVARTDIFKELAHNLAMQVAAMSPLYVTEDEIPEDDKEETEIETACLLKQAYIKEPSMTIQDVIVEAIAKTGENIKVSRIARFELGVR